MMKLIKDNPIKLIFISLLLVFVAVLIATAEPEGFCAGKAFNGKTGVYLTDEEFIFAALKIISWADLTDGVYTESGALIKNPPDEVIKDFMNKHPNCCLVDRGLTSHSINTNQSLLSRALKRKQFLIVAYQDFDGLKNRPEFLGYDDKYLGLDTCGRLYSW